MLEYFLNKITPKKNIGIINHNFERKNLIETKGIVLENDVIIIQNKYIRIDMLIGCLINLTSIFLSSKNFEARISNKIIKRGSVNIDILNSISGTKYVRLKERGVKKATK